MKRKKKNNGAVNQEATEPVKEKKPFPKKLFLIITSIALGIVLLTLGIVLPIVLNDEFTDDANEQPYAIMKLSNGMEIRYEIWEKDCPIAATNFIYLANIGYFDGTVIYDASNDFVRFGGWQADGLHRGDSNTSFTDKITLPVSNDNKNYNSNKFGYRLKEDTAKSGQKDDIGILSFAYERSATEFQISAKSNPSHAFDGGQWEIAPFGMVADERSLNNIIAISNLASHDSYAPTGHSFSAPAVNNNLIKITSVRVHKKYKAKWENFDFIEYYKNGANASSSLQSLSTSKIKAGTYA